MAKIFKKICSNSIVRNEINKLWRTFSCKKKQKGNDPDVCLSQCVHKPSVIIIGAGVAGLSAAEKLLACDINNFVILEATDRVGGRIHSCWMGPVIAELGCDIINGASAINSIYNLAATERLKVLKEPRRRLILTSDGKAIDGSIVNLVYSRFLPLHMEARQLFCMDGDKNHGSLGDFLNIRIEQELDKFPENLQYEAERVFYSLFNSLTTSIGEDIFEVSASSYGSKVILPGGDSSVPAGMIHVISPILKMIPDQYIKYNQAVGTIRWGGEQQKAKGGRVLVQTCSGQTYYGDYVIFTPSLGFLKEHHEHLFCPQLPDYKVEAIKDLGYGHINKIYLKYDSPFWVKSTGNLDLGWSKDELRNDNHWITGITSVKEIPNSNNILKVTVAGFDAEIIEEVRDEEIVQGVTKLLRRFTGDPSLPYPCALLRSSWSKNPYFRGANSFISVDSNIGQQCDLSTPLADPGDEEHPSVLFAGEATIPGHYGTLHGARLSGIREANRIVELTKKMQGPPPNIKLKYSCS